MEGSQPSLEEDDQRRLAPGNPWPVDIDVYLYEDTDPPRFEVVSTLPIDDSDSNDPLLIFDNKGRPGFELRFHLYDQTEKGYRFPIAKDDAVWSIIADTGCPTSEAHQVLKPVRVTQPNGTMLVVENANEEKDGAPIGKFRYTLSVSTTGRAPYLALDPGGVDQNGPTRPIFK